MRCTSSDQRRRSHLTTLILRNTLKRIGLGGVLVLVVSLMGIVFYTRTSAPTRVYAATSSTVNFQARLLSGSGAIVSDGSYNVVFNLYSAPSGGVSQWTETQSVQVKAGYLTVNLGKNTPFPGTIDWSQEQYLTMNVNGDGEMDPRLKLTAVPYAFRAAHADTLTITGGTITGDNLAQLAPSGLQDVNSAVAGLRINQIGSGGLLQLASGGTDKFTIDNTGTGTFAGSLTVSGSALNVGTVSQAGSLLLRDGTGGSTLFQAGATGLQITSGGDLTIGTSDNTATLLVLDTKTGSGDPAGSNGAMYYNSNAGKFRCYQNGGWVDCINGANNNSTASFVSGLANVAGTVTGAAVEAMVFTSATAVSTTAGVTGFTAPAAGSFRTCLVKNNAAITAGTLNVRWRVNGVSVGAAACPMNATTNRQSATALDPGVVTFSAGDTIGLAFDTVGMTPAATNDFTVYWTVEYNATAAASNSATLQSAYNASTATELILDNTRSGLTIRDNAIPIAGNLLEVQDNAGGTTYFGVSASGATSANTLTIGSGGINNSSGGIINAGSITGVGANLTGSGALVLSSGGAGDLSFDSASNKLVIAADDTTMQRTAAGSYTVDLNDGANTTLVLTNSGTGLAGMSIEGGLSAGVGSAFSVNSAGDVTSAFAQLNGVTTTNGTSGAGTSTSLVVTNATNFDVGNYVQINDANCGGTGINPCYAKITNKAANTLTIAPALHWTNGVTVNEFHIPEIGGTDTAQPLAGRYGRGYFISGVAAGNGTTYYGEDSIVSSLSSFDLLNTGVATLNIGGAAGTITIGTGSTTVNVAGGLNVAGTSVIGSGGNLTNIGNITGSGAMIISSGGTGDLSLDSASNKLVIAASDTTMQRTAAGTYTIDLGDGSDTTLTLNNSGAGNANLNLTDGGIQISGTTVLTNGRVLQNVTASTSILTSGTLGAARGGTGVDGSAASNGQLLIGNGSGFSLASLSNNGGLTITPGAGTLGLAVAYGSTSTTAVRGDTGLTCPSGTGNLTGGGTAITLGSGGTCGNIGTINNPTFTTSVTSPLFTGSGAVSVSSGGSSDLTFDSASNKLVIAANDTTLQRTAAGAYTIDLVDSGATSLSINNSGTGAASLNLVDGGLQLNGTSVLSSGAALANLTGISSSGTVALSSLSSGGLVKAASGTGNLSLATGGTDYELPLTFGNGLTRTSNSIALGGNLSSATNIGLNSNALTISGSGGSVFTAFAAGGIEVKADSTAAMAIKGTGGTSYLTVSTSGNFLQVGSSTTDAVAVLSILDSYNNATDPSGTNGASYYNTASSKARCYEDGYWTDCNTTGVLGETTLGAANATIDVTLAKTYESLECRLETKGRSGAGLVTLRFNNVSTAATYSWNSYFIIGTATADGQSSSDNKISLTSTTSSTLPFSASLKITNFSDTRKSVDWTGVSSAAIGTNVQRYSGVGVMNLTTGPITSVQFISSVGTFNAGSHAWCEGRNVR